MESIILGTRSPRRKEILGYFSLPFEQHSSSFDESSVPFSGDPARHVIEISKGKSEDLHHRFSDKIILTADTIVFCEGKVLGIPNDREEAKRTLLLLNGNRHEVYTGVTIYDKKSYHHDVSTTHVFFNHLTEVQIDKYLDQGLWHDKAGGYAIQQGGGLIVRKIEGCFYNVMGLPINTVKDLLFKADIDLWNYLG